MGVVKKGIKTYFKELLDNIISKYIDHQLISRLEDLVEHKLAFCWGSTLQFQLNKPEK